jgi:predicted kinase
MTSTLEPQSQRGLFALLKGASGSGKSTAALSFPKVCVLDFDRKMPGIAMKHFPGKEIHWETFNTIYEVDNLLCQW